MVWSFSEKTTFTGFTTAQQATILAAMQTAYNGSSTARTMFENWISTGKVIDIRFVADTLQAYSSTGIVEIDLATLNNASYISPNGTAVKDTLTTGLVHELGHALTGKRDNWTDSDYKGDNVKFVNLIYKELGLPEQVSYIAYDSSGTIHKLNYQYTNGAAIDAARSGDINMSSAALGTSNDLLIGGPSANILQSSNGNDFLFGAGGNDELNGGTGKDTAVYSGTPLDYDIRKNSDGSWAVRNVRGAKDAGSDTLKNVEVLQFNGGKTYELKKNGLTFQTDFALVIDTTGSMGSSIGKVKAQASSLIDAVFASGKKDGRIGVVGFKDTTEGEPSQVILPFTDQDDFAARKSAAISAINSITVGGGGDLPETSFDGLRVALDGSVGQWRFGAGVLRIALFTDAAAKDGALAGQVNALAKSIGATIVKRSSLAGSRGSVDTFSLAFGGDGSIGTKRGNPDDSNANPDFPFVPSDDPITPDPTTAQVQIFTIFTGLGGFVDTSDLESIADTTGGDFLTAKTDEDLVNILLKIIELPPDGSVNAPPVAVDDGVFNTTLGIPFALNTATLLTNDIDTNGDALSITSVSNATNGTVLLGQNGQISFIPNKLFLGEAAFNYTISDGNSGTDVGTVTLNVILPAGAIIGNNGNNSLSGNPKDNTLVGLGGNDTLNGNGGNDTFLGGDGRDSMNGGNGNDCFDGGEGNDIVNGNGGQDYILGRGGSDQINSGSGNDFVDGGNGNDNLIDNGGNNILKGGDGNDTVQTGSGDDLIYGGLGSDIIRLNGGNDTVVLESGAGFDTIYNFQLKSTKLGVSSTVGLSFIKSGNGVNIFQGGDQIAFLERVQASTLSNNLSSVFVTSGF